MHDVTSAMVMNIMIVVLVIVMDMMIVVNKMIAVLINQVKFYAPWCEHSKAIKAEFEEAALTLRQVILICVKSQKRQIPKTNLKILKQLLTSQIELMLMIMMESQEGSPIRLAEVDATEEKILAKREGVRSSPRYRL